MAAPTRQSSSHELLRIISGRSSIRNKELIDKELQSNQNDLLEGIFHFKKPNPESEKKLKEQTKLLGLEKSYLDFVLKLSLFLNLDQWKSHEIVQAFLLNAYRGTGKNLQEAIKEERQANSLVIKISDYYYAERLYLLHSLKHVLSFWQDDNHPYRAVYRHCFEEMFEGQRLIKGLLKQFTDCLQAVAPTRTTHGPLMTEKHSLRWAIQCLHEQCELLELILLYYREIELEPAELITLIKLFQNHGFGTHQTNKHLFDNDIIAEQLTRRIGFLSSMIVLEGLDLYSLQDFDQENATKIDHFIFNKKDEFQQLLKLANGWSSTIHHGPVVLGMAILASLAADQDPDSTIQSLGQQALQLNVFEYLLVMLETPPFNRDSTVGMICKFIVYGLISSVLKHIHEETLGDIEVVVTLICLTLRNKHICDLHWNQDLKGGVTTLLDSVYTKFPLLFSPLVKLSSALAVGNAQKVYEYLGRIEAYTELLDNNTADDLDGTECQGVLQLVRDKHVLRVGGARTQGMKIPRGTRGILYNEDTEVPIIQWNFSFDAWKMFPILIDTLLTNASYEKDLVDNVTDVIELGTQMLKSNWSLEPHLKPITARVFSILQKMPEVPEPPVDLISQSMKYINVVALHQPLEVWQSLQRTGFIPYTGEVYADQAEAASGVGIFPGHCSKLLIHVERPSGLYTVTSTFLSLISTFVKGIPQHDPGVLVSQDLLACVIFIQHEIFASFNNWRYRNFADREDIGQNALEVFHSVLSTQTVLSSESAFEEEGKILAGKQGVSVVDACVHGLLYGASGESLLAILSTGPDAIEKRIIEQGGLFEGPVQSLTRLIKLSFSVTNRLLELKPDSAGAAATPLERMLTSRPTTLLQKHHLLYTVASYIYHSEDVTLPVLSTHLMRRLALVAPMSIYGCLGDQAEALRDIYLTRLETFAEDTRLKIVILEFLTAAVETQPGLIELFLNVKTLEKQTSAGKDKTASSNKEISLGKMSCLHTVLDLIEKPKQGTTHCHPELLCSALSFLFALWQDRRETALNILRKRPKFWDIVTAPLFKDLSVKKSQEGHTKEIRFQMKACAYAMKIVASECYYVLRGHLDRELHSVLDKMNEEGRYSYWSQFVREVFETRGNGESSVQMNDQEIFENEKLMFLGAWRMFITVAASNMTQGMSLTDMKTKSKILTDSLMALISELTGSVSALNMRAASIIGRIYLTLVKHWPSCSKEQMSQLPNLAWVGQQLEAMPAENALITQLQTVVYSSIIILLQNQGRKGLKVPAVDFNLVSQLLPLICIALTKEKPPAYSTQASTLYGETSAHHPEQYQSPLNSTVAYKYTLPAIAVCLLDQLICRGEDLDPWLPVLRQHSVSSILLGLLQSCLSQRKDVNLAETLLVVLIDMSKKPKIAASLAMCGVSQYLCLPLLNTYGDNSSQLLLPADNLRPQATSAALDQSDEVSWLRVYRSCLIFAGSMLSTLRHSFLEDALNFFGVHQDRMTKCLDAVRTNYSQTCLLEAESTTLLLVQLAHFPSQWRFHMAAPLQALTATLAYLTQSCVSLLIRPKLLQHLIQPHLAQRSQFGRLPPAASGAARLQQQCSTEDLQSATSPKLLQVQCRLLNILSNSLATLKHFSPNFLEIAFNQSLDVCDYPMLFNLGFSTPAADYEGAPSFGTLIACINVCLRYLAKLDGTKIFHHSPLKSPEKEGGALRDLPVDKSVLMFVMDNALLLITSQAARYLKEPNMAPREKQLLKRELGSELNTFLGGLQRYLRRGGPSSPTSASPGIPTASKASFHTSFSDTPEQNFYRIIQNFAQQVLK